MSVAMKTRIALLGASHPEFASRAEILAGSDKLEVAGVYDADAKLAKQVAKELGGQHFAKPKELLGAGSDLVLVAGSNEQNGEHALAAAKAGRPMLIERPGAANLAQLQKIAEVVESKGVFCQVGFRMRYAAHVRQAAEIVSQGFLGRITTARFHCGVPAPELTGERFAAGDRGGMVYSEFCDVLDLLSLYLGAPSEALARFARHEDFARHPFEDAAAILLRFGGVLAAGDCCGWEAQPWKQSWDIQLFGNEGCLEIELGRARLRLFLSRANAPYPAGWTTYEDPGYDPLDNGRRELEDVARRVLVGQTPSGVDIEHALRLGETLERMYGDQGL